jgi:hypothetical protein
MIVNLATFAPSVALPGGPPGPQGPSGAFASYKINSQTGAAAYLASAADAGSLILFSGTTSGVVFSLPPLLAVPGWWCTIKNKNTIGTITVLCTGGALIDGLPSITCDPSCSATIIAVGANFETDAPVDGGTF